MVNMLVIYNSLIFMFLYDTLSPWSWIRICPDAFAP